MNLINVIPFIDGTENADRKRQRLISEQEEGQSTSNENVNDNDNDNETENREDSNQQTWVPRRRLRANAVHVPRPQPHATEPSTADSNEPPTESNGKFINLSKFILVKYAYNVSN